MILYGDEAWVDNYKKSKSRRNTWIVLKCKGKENIYIETINDWLDYVSRNNKAAVIESVGLQYKSHVITQDVDKCDGVYITKAAMGQIGGMTLDGFTIGVVKGDNVVKTLWKVPELIEDNNYTDKIENCFEEAILSNGEEKT